MDRAIYFEFSGENLVGGGELRSPLTPLLLFGIMGENYVILPLIFDNGGELCYPSSYF
jgi:hypothetical protein